MAVVQHYADLVADRYRDRFLVKLIVRTIQELAADDATHMAAAISYYGLLSLFPLTIGLISILSLFLGDSTQANIIQWFSSFFPGSKDLFVATVHAAPALSGTIGVFAIVGLFWSGSAIFGGITRSINRAWDVHTDRPLYLSKVRQLAMALLTSLLFLFSTFISTFLGVYERFTIVNIPYADVLLSTGSVVILHASSFTLVLTVFLMLYKYVPNTKTHWRYIWVGAVVAAVLFEVTKELFIIYLNTFTGFHNVYGSLAPVIALLIWAYMSGLILIIGAELSSEYGRLREGVDRGRLISDRRK